MTSPPQAPVKTTAEYIRQWKGTGSLREFARLVGVDHTALMQYERGSRPRIDIALRIADRLALKPTERAAWFAACGYDDPGAPGELTYEPILDEATVQAFREADLPAEDIAILNEEMRRLIQEKRRARGFE